MTPKQFVTAYKKDGSIKAVSKRPGMTYYSARKAYLEAKDQGLIQPLRVGRKTADEVVTPVEPKIAGQRKAKQTPTRKLPAKGKVKRYLCTSAQNNTFLHEELYANLLAFAKHVGAELLISRFAYQRSGLNRGGDKAEWAPTYEDQRMSLSAEETHKNPETLYGSDRYVWAPEVYDHVSDERMELAPGLVWCGEWQRSPTTVNPLSGFQVYTGQKSGIFPHVKLCMESVPTAKHEPAKFNYTTGTITMRNYIQKGAGLKAEFHHCYGAALIEVDNDGDWFVRQISADSDGTFYDLDVRVRGGNVTTGHRIEGLTLGDIHEDKKDPTVHQLQAKMHNELNPRHTFYNDLLNFGRRNHHERKDPFKSFERFVENNEDVRGEVEKAMDYLGQQADRWPDTRHVVVDSNHDRALERWLREVDWRHDPINMMFYMEAAHAKLSAIAQEDDDFHMLRHWWGQREGWIPGKQTNVVFLDEDESFVICDDPHGGIENGMHGHLGANGSRGNIKTFAKMGRRANIGHSHSAGIVEGIWQAGTSSLVDLGYNRGMSGWSHSHILTYANGKRCMITMRNGKYRAGMKPLSGELKVGA
ncbi:MAG: hypothetical protein V3R87_03585 [Dehalococcoidia bacterium]